MRGFGELTRQVLTWEVQLLVQVHPPLGTIGHVINDAMVSDKFSCPALACVAAEFHFCDNDVRDAHGRNYTGLLNRIERRLHVPGLHSLSHREKNVLPPCRRSRLLVLLSDLFDRCQISCGAGHL